MGMHVTNNIRWMDNLKEIKCINVRKGREHTVEYIDTGGHHCAVRVPASFAKFCVQLKGAVIRKHQVA